MNDIRKRLYNVYNHVIFRCTNPNCEHYHRYGGRGIRTELGDFETFYNRMIDSYTKHLNEFGYSNTTLERINNDQNYSYDNIKWATRKEQAQNRSTTSYFLVYNTIDGTKLVINNAVEFCNRVGIAWTSFNAVVGKNKPIKNFIIDYVDTSAIGPEELQDIHSKCKSIPLKIEAYQIYGLNTNIIVTNLKDWCRGNGVDPSTAYKCAKGKRLSANGYIINKTIIEVKLKY